MTYSNDFLLFYAYSVVVFGALLVSALTLTADAASGSFRQWRLGRALKKAEQTSEPLEADQGIEALQRRS